MKVIIAALCLKIYDPLCDTRYHQKTHGGKYCLRSIEQHTTQWCASHGFFSTNCVGSLSNALRHKEPYTKDYSRVWKSTQCKNDFLSIFEIMNNDVSQGEIMLAYTMQKLKTKMQAHIALQNIIIEPKGTDLYSLLCELCRQAFNKSSIIPVIIVHTYYKVAEHPGLLSLKAHNSPDIRGKSYGDIEIWNNSTNIPDTIIEIKHGLEIKTSYLQTFSKKVKDIKCNNYILTSLDYQRYEHNSTYNVICWNVASFVHFHLYNRPYIDKYISTLYVDIMNTSIDIKHKENLKKIFQY